MATQVQTAQPQVARLEPRPAEPLIHHWRTILLVAVVVAIYATILKSLAADAIKDPDYSHIIFVPFFSGWLIWRQRKELAAMKPQPSALGLLVVLGSIGILFVGSLGAELFLSRASLLGVVVGLVIYFGGWRILRALLFPLFFLVFMVPLPALVYNEIVFPLQLVASKFATNCLEVVDVVPVLRQGNLLVLPNYTLEVVEACSGIRSLMALLTLATAYGYLAEKRVWVRVVLVAMMVPLAIFGNGLRVFSAALVTYYIGPKYAEGYLHTFSGLAIFLIATVLLVALHTGVTRIAKYLRRREA